MKLLRIGIFVLVVFSIAAHGAVEDWAYAVLETGAGLLFVAWAVQEYFAIREIVLSPLLPPLLALGLLVLGQIVFRGTASTYHTRVELQLLFAYAMLLFLASQAFRRAEDWRVFVWFVMSFGFLVAVVGILQHLTFNGKLYWFREMRYGGIPFGPYVNRNHFAGFAELVIPVALVPLMLGKVRRERLVVVGLFPVVSIGGLFLAASRGGIISFVVQVAIIVLWMAVRRTGRRQILAGAGVLVGALLMVSWLGVKEITQRFSTMKTLEVTGGKRDSMRRDTWRIFVDHPWMGTGLGTLQEVFPPYESLYDGRIWDHRHKDDLEELA